MAVLLNHTNPAMRIFIPDTGLWREFSGGKLEIDADDPDFAVVMAEASRNPSIVVFESVTTCTLCGEAYTGKTAAANLATHRKNDHYAEYLAEKDAKAADVRNAEIKAREGVPCDICPHAVFPDEAALALHVKVMHASAPAMDDDGNLQGEGREVSTAVPAAKPTA